MSQFSLVAVGGTFDVIHRGHLTLLSNAFLVSEKVIIGLTSDALARRKGKVPTRNYEQRLENLRFALLKEFSSDSFQIIKLDDDFGAAVLEENVDALIVSAETCHQGDVLNEQRAKKGLLPVQIVLVPMSLAKDGIRISSTRIKNSEIDSEGNLLSVDN